MKRYGRVDFNKYGEPIVTYVELDENDLKKKEVR